MEEKKLDKDINVRSKLTDEEIVKALECCAMISVNPYLRGECIDCPYFQKHIDCVEGKRSEMDCIDLIHRLQSENKGKTEHLEKCLDEIDRLKTAYAEQNAELERYAKMFDDIEKRISEEIRKETAEKFASLVKENSSKCYATHNGVKVGDTSYTISGSKIDKICKEITGGGG